MKYRIEELENNIRRIIVESSVIRVKLLNTGATIEEIEMINKKGEFETITLTYENHKNYLECEKYGFVGVNIARHGGRIKNGEFTINGKKWILDKNDGNNNLHSGNNGIYNKLMNFEVTESDGAVVVNFKHKIMHQDDKFPGDLELNIKYTISKDKLTINYDATSSEDTICNITNHSYFNLSGNLKETIGDHLIKDTFKNLKLVDEQIFIHDEISFSQLTDNKEWTKLKEIIPNELLINGKGLDNPLELKDGLISIKDPSSGRTLEISTSYPAVVLYSSNHPFNTKFKYNDKFIENIALAIEPQYLPNDINMNNEDSKTILRAGEKYAHSIEYKFTI